MESEETVWTGNVMTSATLVSAGRPAARTRDRRSRSVRIPQLPSHGISNEEILSRAIRDAASATTPSAGKVTGGRRMSELTRTSPRSRGPRSCLALATRRCRLAPIRLSPSPVPRTSLARAASMR